MTEAEARRGDDTVSRGVSLLAANGFPRVPAMVLMTLMVTESGELTADELAEASGASPAAISGAVRYLMTLGTIRRHHVPGSRRYIYELPDEAWYIASVKTSLYTHIADFAEDATIALEGRPRERMADMASFFRYLESRMPALLQEWRDERA